MDILDDMGVSKLSAQVFLKVNYSFNFQKISITLLLLTDLLHILFVVLRRKSLHALKETWKQAKGSGGTKYY